MKPRNCGSSNFPSPHHLNLKTNTLASGPISVPHMRGSETALKGKKKQKTNTIDLGRGYTLVPRKKYAYGVWTLLLLTLVLLGPF